MNEIFHRTSPYAGCTASAPLAFVTCYRTACKMPEYAQIDMSTSVENLLLEADSLGLGAVWLGIAPLKEHMEAIRTYVRGHNLFDIFYGKYKKEEKELLKKYIEIAPRKEFSDILDAADSFIYFQSKTKQKDK